MLYALDTEFIEDGKTIDLISIGIVSEEGREFYAQNIDFNEGKAGLFVRENVLPRLVECPADSRIHHGILLAGGGHCQYGNCPWLHRPAIAEAVQYFIGYDAKPIFWGYYSAYDWVAFCQLFSTRMGLPIGWPMYCRDLRQYLDNVGRTEVKQHNDMPHNARSDARWIIQTLLTAQGIYRKSVHG